MTTLMHAMLRGVRSKLFVPASRPELFAKAFTSGADSVSIDLEDSVRAEMKADARQELAAWLAAHQRNRHALTIVRVNAMNSGEFVRDMAACVNAGVHVINLPKVSAPSQIEDASDLLTRLERDRGIERPLALLPTIETPAGLRNAAAIATAGSRVTGLQLGLGDLFAALGAEPANANAVDQARFIVRCAAAEAEVPALDSAFANVQDESGFMADAQRARAMGFTGKSCIHPRQIGWAHRVFGPSDDSVAHAKRLLDAAESDANATRGAFVFEGSMVDEVHLRRARHLVAEYEESKQCG